MRKYAATAPTDWQGDIKKLRGDLEAIAVYYNLTTSANSTMTGLYLLPVAYLAYDLGCPIEGASKALARIIEAGICSYDEEREIVWVHEAAAQQIAPRLKPGDHRVTHVANKLANFPICMITMGFYWRYREAFHLFDKPQLAEFEHAFQSEAQAPSEPLRSQKQSQGQLQDKIAFEKEEINTREIEKNTPAPQKQTATFSTDGAARSSSKASDANPYEEPYDPEPTPEAGRAKLQELRVPAQFIGPALHKLQAGKLVNSDLERWRAEARGAAA